MRFVFVFLIFVFSLFGAEKLDEAKYNAGEMLYFSKGCNGCHGADAEGSTTYPRLANKPAKYLAKRIAKFKSGKVDTVSQQMMAQFVEKLSKEQIEKLIYFFANHKQSKPSELDDDILGGFGS